MPSAFALIGLLLLGMTSCSMRQKNSVALPSQADHAIQNLVQFARPMCGTAGNGNTFPGATVPFGMIQWSPDSEAGMHKGGYSARDKRISDFSVDHISGAGCRYGGDFAMMPIRGPEPLSPPDDRSAFAAPFSHINEMARPGYYAVTFDNGIKAELTATLRTGFGRFTYPANGAASMMINAASDINGSDASGISLDPATREISGWSTGGHFCNSRAEARTIYFYAIFDRPFAAWSTWSGKVLTKGATHGTGTASGVFVTFDMSRGRTVLAKVGISYVSITNAKANVEAENPISAFASNDFDKAMAAASDAWNSWLNKIQVSGGTPGDRETLYTMLYHVALGPIVVSDANGQYTGYDGRVHTVAAGREQYGVFSGWDVYRSECQLLGMLAPKRASDMAQSLLTDYQQGGAFPHWGVMTRDSGAMLGDPAAPMIAGFYAFGATNFDARAALEGLVRAATDPTVQAKRTKAKERDALEDYLKLGYVPEDPEQKSGKVSMTLEYASADFAVSEFAKALGDEAVSALLRQQARNWRNLYNPESGYLEMRRRDGSWAPGFTNNVQRYDNNNHAYVEGSAAQYVWMVPFDLKGLAELMGGPDMAAKRLDFFFTKLNAGAHSEYAYLGNEPCLLTPWIYDFLGQPWKTQNTVRRALTKLYSARDNGFVGSDDVGAMSSWYVFGALGMYPALPGSDVLVLGSPLFPKAVLHLSNGDVTITGNGAARNAPYVQNLTVNGQAWNKPWIRYADISRGGTLEYDLGTTANTNWGNNLADAPPSCDGQ